MEQGIGLNISIVSYCILLLVYGWGLCWAISVGTLFYTKQVSFEAKVQLFKY
jgi:hypothetical protein